MPLNINTEGGGDFLPIIKYDTRAGRMIRLDRVQGHDGWDTDEVDITDKFTVIMDLANAEEGYLAFNNGRPDFHMVLTGEPFPDQPSESHRHAFRVPVFSQKVLGGLREFSHAAITVTAKFKDLYGAWEAAPESGNGQVPVVTLAGTTSKKINVPGGGQSTVYVPDFQISKWIDRPDELGPVKPRNAAAPEPRPKRSDHADGDAAKPAQVADDVAADDNAPEF